MNTLIWVSSARYSQPLDTTTRIKWQMLRQGLGREIVVVGFSAPETPSTFHDEVTFYVLRPPRFALLRYVTFYTRMPWLLARLMGASEGVTLIAQSPFEGVVGAWMKRRFGSKVRLIIETHNNFEEDLFMQRCVPLKWLVQSVMRRAAGYAYGHADAIRTISQSTEDQARKYAPTQPVRRFMAWSNVEVFRNVKRDRPASACVDIAYCGVLIPRKGIHVLLRAFAALAHPTARLLLVGSPDNQAYASELAALANSLNMADRVVFVGHVPQPSLAQYMAQARVMVLPSFSEGLGRVVVEAMLTGTPVIGTRVGGIPDIIHDGETGYLVPPDDVEALTQALGRVFNHPEYDTMAHAAQQFARAFFSSEGYVQGYRDLIADAEFVR